MRTSRSWQRLDSADAPRPAGSERKRYNRTADQFQSPLPAVGYSRWISRPLATSPRFATVPAPRRPLLRPGARLAVLSHRLSPAPTPSTSRLQSAFAFALLGGSSHTLLEHTWTPKEVLRVTRTVEWEVANHPHSSGGGHLARRANSKVAFLTVESLEEPARCSPRSRPLARSLSPCPSSRSLGFST